MKYIYQEKIKHHKHKDNDLLITINQVLLISVKYQQFSIYGIFI